MGFAMLAQSLPRQMYQLLAGLLLCPRDLFYHAGFVGMPQNISVELTTSQV
jgi:hypothetical protein